MKNNGFKTLVLAFTLLAAGAGAAQAAVNPFTLVADGTDESFQSPIKHLRGGGTLSFSNDLIGALEVAGIQTSTVAPATVSITSDDDGRHISAAAPLLTLSGDLDDATSEAVFTQIGTIGGASMVAPEKNFATTTGSLSLTGITVDPSTKAIYADLTGGNGVGALKDVQVWTYTDISGPTALVLTVGTQLLNNKLTGLVITDNAFDLFAQSLGLTNAGIAAMRSITDYGVMESHIAFDIKFPITPTVPEPSVGLMMALGLAGLGFASRRARHA